MDRTTGSLRGNTWRSWREVGKDGKVENSFGERILKGGVMS